jgi:hypothetical protein
MNPRVQGINKKISWSMLTNSKRLPSMNGMMTELKKPERVKTEAIMTLVLLVFSIGGCSLEDVDMQTIDTNHSDDSALPSLANPMLIPQINQVQPSVPLDRMQLDSLMEENLKEFGAEFSKMLPQPDKVDYERLQFLFQQSLLDREPKSPENKFQFLCDANERWIYRCNLVTGEIVCYSMGSDYKLKRLDTVEGEK